MNYKLNEHLRKELKKPLGQIIERTKAFQGAFLVVGDAGLSNALEDKKEPWIGIYDNLIKRKPSGDETRKIILEWNAKKVLLENPAGTITEKAMKEIKKTLQSNEKTKIEVKGEEDLLVLPCLVFAPIDTNVYYGQPGEGMVLVKANQKNKEKARKMLEEMRQ